MIDKGSIVLEGSLSDIKKSYPRDRVLVVPERGRVTELQKLIDSKAELNNTVLNTELTADGLLIKLSAQDGKTALFNYISQSDIDIDIFRVVEPTLEEIFVEKAGGEYEAV